MAYQHEAAEKFYDEVLSRIKDTDWRYLQAYNPTRFYSVIAKADVVPPTSEQMMAGKYPDHYYRIDSLDFESFAIGVDATLKQIGL